MITKEVRWEWREGSGSWRGLRQKRGGDSGGQGRTQA